MKYHDSSIVDKPEYALNNTSRNEKVKEGQTEEFFSLSAAIRYPYSPCWPAPYEESVLPGVT